MAEKGGKGFSLPNRKSSLKTPVSKGGKGKDDGSAHKKVQFDTSSDSEGSPKVHSNGSTKSSGQGLSGSSGGRGKDSGKGGKGGKSGKASGKSTAPRVPTIPEFKVEAELPQNAACLMDCDAEVVLQGIQEQLVVLSRDVSIKLPVAFGKALQYAKSGSQYKNPQAVREVLEKLKVLKISEGEICLLANICPETSDEVYALIPSLKPNRLMTEGAIKDVLHELNNLKS